MGIALLCESAFYRDANKKRSRLSWMQKGGYRDVKDVGVRLVL